MSSYFSMGTPSWKETDERVKAADQEDGEGTQSCLGPPTTSRARPYFIVIDELDEAWADDSIRYNLIHALIETIRDFQKVRHVKDRDLPSDGLNRTGH